MFSPEKTKDIRIGGDVPVQHAAHNDEVGPKDPLPTQGSCDVMDGGSGSNAARVTPAGIKISVETQRKIQLLEPRLLGRDDVGDMCASAPHGSGKHDHTNFVDCQNGGSHHSFSFDAPAAAGHDRRAVAPPPEHQSESYREASLAAEIQMEKVGRALDSGRPDAVASIGGGDSSTASTKPDDLKGNEATAIARQKSAFKPIQASASAASDSPRISSVDCSSVAGSVSHLSAGGSSTIAGGGGGGGSNQTMITDHLTRNKAAAPAVVAESPPIPSSIGKGDVDERTAPVKKRAILGNVPKESSRKKSIPVKRPLHSVGDASGATSNAATPTGRSDLSSPSAAATGGGGGRKRTRLQFTAIGTEGKDEAAAAPKQQQPQQQALHRALSPAHLSEPASSSRDRTGSSSNPSSSNRRASSAKGGVKSSNNARLTDFFGAVAKAKSKKVASSSGGTNHPSTPQRNSAGSSSSTASEARTGKSVPAVSRSTSTVGVSDSQAKEIERLGQQCQSLERMCQDKDEQLKAVANNQTMIHAQLKAALAQREKDIEELRQTAENKSTRAAETIERLIRAESARDAKDLREKLAADGARLGRLVYTRAGLHTVENWEEGHEPRVLAKRRAELRAKRKVLEERQRAVRKAARKLASSTSSSSSSAPVANVAGPLGEMGPPSRVLQEGAPSSIDADGIVLQDELEAMEAEESVRIHLAKLKQQELELYAEERALNVEKRAHIRSLKRVASEDASKFRSRPKLHDRFILLNLLGKGGFSEVWHAYDLDEMKEVAVKIHQLETSWSESKKENYTKHVAREYEIHRDVRHSRIVSLYDVFEIDTDSFATVLEYCKGTDLDTLLKDKITLPERDARAILLQILSGMRYLSMPSDDGSRQGIIHYDLKPGNILFDEFGDAKITDFGLSKIVDASDPADSMELTSQGAGTYWYLPPECFVVHQNVRISNKVDVWSIGVIYYQMLFGRRPFGDGQTQDKVLRNQTMLNAREVKFPPKPQVSEESKNFIRQCLTYDQAFRPTIAQLCKHPYLHQKKL